MIRRSMLVALLLSIFASASPVRAQTKSTIVPADWLPALAPSLKSALDNLRDADSQSEMNRLSREVADMTDAQLFIAYVRLYEKLSPKEREKLFAEQAAWLKKRPAAAKKRVESSGGSLAPLEANNAEVTYTEKRLTELRARFKALGAKKNTDDENE
ncbi:MAG: lysozyme inhibitor LprI family protein [Verrucomicrobiota bacterium]|nr:lysozyme inhibitor LprI family protein [Verrucomicrobiota bacterium]